MLPEGREPRCQGRCPFIESHIIKTTTKAFDDFAAGNKDTGKARRMLGLE